MSNDIVPAAATGLPKSNRRLFLVAGTAMALTATLKSVAHATDPGADPIFAAIERHKELFAIFTGTCDRADEVKAKREGREVTEADEAALEAACDAEMDAAAELVAIPPTTVAGMRAAIEYIVEYDKGCVPHSCAQFLATLLESPLLAVEGAHNV
jgi:hypothetical protein